jgi:hypothetical protein
MKAAVRALVRQGEAKSAFLVRVLIRVEAVIDHDPIFIEENSAENVRVAFANARNSKKSMGVIELDPELQMLLDNIVNRDGRFNRDTAGLGKVRQQRSYVTLDLILGKIRDLYHVVVLSSASVKSPLSALSVLCLLRLLG